jgi:hypothetical protein
VKFFLDNCISPAIAESIAILARSRGHTVIHLTERFDASTPDIEWIFRLQEEGDWIIVSADPRITHSRVEQAAWRESGLTAFFLEDFSRRSFWVQAQELVRWWPLISDAAKEARSGTGYVLKFNAKAVTKIYEPLG